MPYECWTSGHCCRCSWCSHTKFPVGYHFIIISSSSKSWSSLYHKIPHFTISVDVVLVHWARWIFRQCHSGESWWDKLIHYWDSSTIGTIELIDTHRPRQSSIYCTCFYMFYWFQSWRSYRVNSSWNFWILYPVDVGVPSQKSRSHETFRSSDMPERIFYV